MNKIVKRNDKNRKNCATYLGLAETGDVGDIVDGVGSEGRLAACAALGQSVGLEDLVKARVLLQELELHVHGAAHHGAQVGRARAHVSQALVAHELVAHLLHEVLDLRGKMVSV